MNSLVEFICTYLMVTGIFSPKMPLAGCMACTPTIQGAEFKIAKVFYIVVVTTATIGYA